MLDSSSIGSSDDFVDFEITVNETQTWPHAPEPWRSRALDVRGILRIRSCCTFHWQERQGDGLITVAVGAAHCDDCVEQLRSVHPSWTFVARIC